MSKRPNILLIVTDQQRADWLGCAGHPVVKTPNIDALAARGTRFEDFHVALPVCMPNRASLMTGRMPSLHGLRYNGCALPRRANTFVDVLAAGGYRTALIGKGHVQPFTTQASLRAPDTTERLIEEAWKDDGEDYTAEQPATYARDAKAVFEQAYYGFQHAEIVTRHGDKCGGHYEQWFRQTAPDWKALRDPKNELAHNYSCPQAYRTPIPEELYPTHWIGDRAIDYLQVAGDDPFFAMVSFPDPHHPFNPPGKYWDMYDPDDFDVPLPYAAHQNPTPPMQYVSQRFEAGDAPRTPQMTFRATDAHIREAMALTAGMITMIDDQIGRIVASLEASGQLENTVIIFTSDHGDYMGDFNMLLKGAMQFASTTRVPFVWTEPGEGQGKGQARRTKTMASTIDISASILERVGLAPYNGIQGESFLASLDGVTPHRDAVLIEYNASGAREGLRRSPRFRTWRSADWRLTIAPGEDWGELYDVLNDPNETRNLWNDPDHSATQAALMTQLAQALALQMDESPRSKLLA